MRLPDKQFTVVVLENAIPSGVGIEPNSASHVVADIYLGPQLDPRPVVNANVTPRAYDGLVGRYDFDLLGVVTITKEGDRLFWSVAGRPPRQLLPMSETEFFVKDADVRARFVKDSTGKVIRVVRYDNTFVVSGVPSEEVAVAKLDPAAYEAVVGKYDYFQGKAILTVTHEGDHLYAQLTGQPKFEIYPKSATEFFWKVVSAQVTFVKDDKGVVTKAIHHQAGRVIEAPKIE
jgi:hypothetical protein